MEVNEVVCTLLVLTPCLVGFELAGFRGQLVRD